MKYFFTCIIVFAFLSLSAQKGHKPDHFPGQLKKVITEATGNFKNIVGDKIKDDGTDIIYTSKINLDGTTDNQVLNIRNGNSYMAKIGEAANEKGVKSILENWKKKVLAVLGSGYEVVPDDQKSAQSDQKGYLLMSDQLSVSIHAIKYNDEEKANLFLLIMKL